MELNKAKLLIGISVVVFGLLVFLKLRNTDATANSAFQRLAVTEQLLNESTRAFDLAQSRYGLGLSSIVELSQAQLNKTQAEIAGVSAEYDYEVQTHISNLNSTKRTFGSSPSSIFMRV
jgi:hypothetical protein